MCRDDVAQLIAAACRGDDDAFHNLIEASHAVIPLLIELFQHETDGAARARIVEIVWQHTQPTSVSFLSMALRDSCPEVWKQALDGLVTIGGPKARSTLVSFIEETADDERVTWACEAVKQLAPHS